VQKRWNAGERAAGGEVNLVKATATASAWDLRLQVTCGERQIRDGHLYSCERRGIKDRGEKKRLS